MKLIHLLYLTGTGCFFLCGAADTNDTDCQPRQLTVTVDDILRLYIDGVEITNLTNAKNWRRPDSVELPCNAKVIGIQGTDLMVYGGILASTDDGYILTNSSWKCTNIYFTGWQTIYFDDSDWPWAFDAVGHEPLPDLSASEIRKNARWIWTTAYKNGDQMVYCRKTLDTNECILGPPDNECDPSMGKCKDFYGSYKCSCYGGYINAGSKRCEDVDECALDYPINKCGSATGSCVNLPGSYNCSCHQGYHTIDTQASKVSTGNDSTSLIILGVLFGVSVLGNIALVSALFILHRRNKTTKDEGQSGLGTNTYQNNIVLDGEQNDFRSSPIAGKAYDNLNSETFCRDEPDHYEQI